MKKLWFRRRHYGWGWSPATWQGWFVLFIYFLILILLFFRLKTEVLTDELLTTFFVPLIILTSVLLIISYKTGEKPRWQWGKFKK